MTTATLTLTDFLLARIAEDEAVARGLIAEGTSPHERDLSGPTRDDEYSGLNIGAGRVLSQCGAVQRIVWRAQNNVGSGDRMSSDARAVLHATLRDLASVYSDHPDYRSEWAV